MNSKNINKLYMIKPSFCDTWSVVIGCDRATKTETSVWDQKNCFGLRRLQSDYSSLTCGVVSISTVDTKCKISLKHYMTYCCDKRKVAETFVCFS